MTTQESEPAGDESGRTIDYGSVEIPSEPATEYHYTARRAEILDIIEAKGHPAAVSRKELAERYDVSPSQISRDMNALAEHVAERITDRDRRALTVDTVVNHCVEELIEAGEHRAAVRSILDYDEWARQVADLEALEDRLNDLETRLEDRDHV